MGTLRFDPTGRRLPPVPSGAAAATVQLATAFGSRVTVLHVRQECNAWPVSPFENQDRLTQLAGRREGGRLAEFIVRAGPPGGHRRDGTGPRSRRRPARRRAAGQRSQTAEPRQPGRWPRSILEQAGVASAGQSTRTGPSSRSRSILCPVDHSRVSRPRPLEDAIQLARAASAASSPSSNVVPEVSWLPAGDGDGRPAEAEFEREAKSAEEFDEYHAARLVRWGRVGAWSFTTAYRTSGTRPAARDRGAGLLVMGATGRTGVVRVLLGSVTAGLLRQLPCSLLLVKDEAVFERQFLLDLDAIDRLAAEGDGGLVRVGRRGGREVPPGPRPRPVPRRGPRRPDPGV